MSSNTIYNHRSLQPSAPNNPSGTGLPPGLPALQVPQPIPGPSHNNMRVTDAFEVIRQEFDLVASDIGVVRAQRDEYEAKLQSQINELNLFRQQLYELESQHAKVRQQYEEEMARLRADLHALRQQQVQAPANPSSASGAPPFPDPYYARERELRERERERDAKRFKPDRPKEVVPPTPTRGPPDVFSPSLSSTSMPKLPPPGNTSSTTSSAPLPLPSVAPPQNTEVSAAAAGAFPEDIDVQSLPAEYKREGSDWFALFPPNPTSNPPGAPPAKRNLDVQLIHALMHESVVCCVRFSHDGKYLATGCNRTAQIYDVKTGQKTAVLVDENASKSGDLYIRSVCFSPDGKWLATGAEDKQIRIWDIAKRRIRNIFDGHQQEIYSLDFSSDGRLIVSGSGDKTARIWDMLDGTSKVLTINDPDSLNNDAGVTSVAISPNGQLVAAGSLDTVVRIWDVSTGQLVERLRGHRDSVYSVAFTPDGKGLISGSLDKTLKFWDVSPLLKRKEMTVKPGEAGKCTMNFVGHKDYVLSVAVSHDGRWVVSGSKDRGVQFWDAATAQVQCMLQGHKNSVISIDLSPAGNILATGSGDWQARIWGYTTAN